MLSASLNNTFPSFLPEPSDNNRILTCTVLVIETRHDNKTSRQEMFLFNDALNTILIRLYRETKKVLKESYLTGQDNTIYKMSKKKYLSQVKVKFVLFNDATGTH